MLHRCATQSSKIFALASPGYEHRLRSRIQRTEELLDHGLLIHRLRGQHDRRLDLGNGLSRNEAQDCPGDGYDAMERPADFVFGGIAFRHAITGVSIALILVFEIGHDVGAVLPLIGIYIVGGKKAGLAAKHLFDQGH